MRSMGNYSLCFPFFGLFRNQNKVVSDSLSHATHSNVCEWKKRRDRVGWVREIDSQSSLPTLVIYSRARINAIRLEIVSGTLRSAWWIWFLKLFHRQSRFCPGKPQTRPSMSKRISAKVQPLQLLHLVSTSSTFDCSHMATFLFGGFSNEWWEFIIRHFH